LAGTFRLDIDGGRVRGRALRRIFGATWEEVTGEWRKLHNEELHNLYSSN
jgi:hypothetical protein